MKELTKELKAYALNSGADLVGVASLEKLTGIQTIPDNMLQPFTRALVIAHQLSPEIFNQITDRPTPLYAHQYAAVNQLLDHINLLLQSKILKLGYQSLAIPASQTIDYEKQMGHISTKAIARVAGLGWQGKSLLLITPQFGPRVRIACLLTDAPLMADSPLANRCGRCTCCRDACPAGAIYGTAWQDYPASRAEAIDVAKCVAHLSGIAKQQGLVAHICGVCIKACPWGRTKPTGPKAN